MKTILVTGASDGIGRETARQLLERGAQVLVHGRSEARALRVAGAFEGGERVTPVWADFASMSEVAALARRLATLVPHLDVLINNAGTYESARRLTVDGFEATMAINHFAPYLLTRLTLPLLEAAPAGRIVNVSSMTHASADLDVGDLDLARSWSAYGAYATSKLANVLFTRALAARLEHVTANALHPGVIGTKLLRAGFGAGGAPVAEGARTPVYLALSPDVAGISGEYFVSCRRKSPGRSARDADLAEALWAASERRLARWLPAGETGES